MKVGSEQSGIEDWIGGPGAGHGGRRYNGDVEADVESLLAAISAEGSFAGATGRGVRVAVIDGGVGSGASALREEAVFRRVQGEVRRCEGPTTSRSAHGSAVAEILTRIAPEVELYSADVLDGSGQGDADAVLAGMEWALDRGCRVINMSLGLTPADLPRAERRWRFAEAVERAYFSGAVIVAAAHNLHEQGIDALPASFASVVGVDKRLLGSADRFDYAPRRRVEFAAHGKSGRAEYRFTSATSFAAPHVSGFVALLLESCPDLRPFEVKTILYRVGESWSRAGG